MKKIENEVLSQSLSIKPNQKYNMASAMFSTNTSHMCDVMDEELHSSIEQMRPVVREIMRLSHTKDTKSLQIYCKNHESTIKHLLAYCNNCDEKQETFRSLVAPYV